MLIPEKERLLGAGRICYRENGTPSTNIYRAVGFRDLVATLLRVIYKMYHIFDF